MQEDYERQLTEMEESKEQALEELTEYYENKLTEKSAQLEQVNSRPRAAIVAQGEHANARENRLSRENARRRAGRRERSCLRQNKRNPARNKEATRSLD